MTFQQFIDLDEMEQQEAIWDGKFVADTEDDEHKILLYKIDSFYVEVYLHKEFNVIRKYKPLASVLASAIYKN